MFARAIAGGLQAAPAPWLVDDSQMMGGLLARNYPYLPESIRIFASHGGFVGGGLATAVGLAVSHPGSRVVAMLGDQGFTNGVQALATVRELQVPLLVLVCNNGASVSLGLQASADGVGVEVRAMLENVPGMSYAAIARGFGLSASTFRWADPPHTQDVPEQLTTAIAEALADRGPRVLELVTPGTPRFWSGVWRVAGLEGESEEDARVGDGGGETLPESARRGLAASQTPGASRDGGVTAGS